MIKANAAIPVTKPSRQLLADISHMTSARLHRRAVSLQYNARPRHQSPICSRADEICVEKGRDAGEKTAPKARASLFDVIWTK